MAMIGWRELLILLVIVLLIFGTKRLTSGMRELAWHLFTWGDQAVILQPQRLKTVMAEALAAAGRALDAAG